MKTCQKCGKPLQKCMCHVEVDLEDILEQWKKEKKAGRVTKKVTEDQVKQKAKEKKPQTQSELLGFFEFIGFDENACKRTWAKVQKSLAKSAKHVLHSLIDDLLPEESDMVIEADYEIECPDCGKMVEDLKNHGCKGKK